MEPRVLSRCAVILTALGLQSCAGSGALLRAPAVDLTRVEVREVSLASQTFLLGFNVSNPNPIPLPVKSVRYRVRLNDQNFAGGETQSNFTIPAGGDGSFIISVDIDLLRSGAQLASILRSGVQDDVDYELYGDLALDIPTSPSLGFSSSGTIMVQSELF